MRLDRQADHEKRDKKSNKIKPEKTSVNSGVWEE